MKNSVLVSLTILFFLGRSFAQGDVTATKDSSHVGLGTGIKAGIWSVFWGLGAEIFYESTSQWQLGISFVEGKTVAPAYNDITIGGRYAALQGRYFFGNTFSASGGAGFRQVRATYDQTHIDGLTTEGDYEIDSVLLTADIGNVWKWDSGFFVGADWIGVMYSIHDQEKNNVRRQSWATVLSGNEEGEKLEYAGFDVQQAARRFSVRTMLTTGYRF